MPYLFRCDACGAEHDTGEPSLATEVAEDCVSCGQNGCPACIINGLCDSCFDDIATQEEDTVDGNDNG